MDQIKTGKLICVLRKEKGLTQLALAEKLGVSDRAVSKWERGLGCPDVGLLKELAAALNVDVERLLSGEMEKNGKDGGNMKRIRFYVCPACGNIMTATTKTDISCCGRKVEPLEVRKADEAHAVKIEPMDDELYISFPHPMDKGHFIRFIAYVNYDRTMLVRLYPEQGGELRMPALRGGKFYCCCSEHGLFEL